MTRPGAPEPLYTLGINAAFHDSAACLVRDGAVLAAAEEERFTHVKHAKRPVPFSTRELPFNAIDYCLAQAGIALADVHHVAYSYDPWIGLGHDAAEPALTLPLSPSAHARPAALLAANQVVGWFQRRREFGPRARGALHFRVIFL